MHGGEGAILMAIDFSGQMADDLDVFLDPDAGFGVDATVDGISVEGIFDAEYVESLEVEETAPALLCKTSLISTAAHGDTVVIAGVNYTVKGIKPDGTGLTLLILRTV